MAGLKDRQPIEGVTMKTLEDMFRHKRPCADCPFRKVGGLRHGPNTLAYASYFLTFPGFTFPCHATRPQGDVNERWGPWCEGQTLCTGGLILATKLGRENAIMQIGREAGLFDPTQLDQQDQVVDSIAELVRVQVERWVEE